MITPCDGLPSAPQSALHLRLLVCGGRDYADAETAAFVLNRIRLRRHIAVLIEGGALGADRLAREWAVRHGITISTYLADWSEGRAAGPRRNARMLVEGKPGGVVAFPGGRGTADMVRRSRDAGVPVWEIPIRPPMESAS